MRKTAETDDDAADAEAGLPSDMDLNATVALSEDMLAALLEEVKRTRSAPVRADGTPGPALSSDGDDPASNGVADSIHGGDEEGVQNSDQSRDQAGDQNGYSDRE